MTEPLRILILEDNPADAELVQFELHEAGLVFTSKVVMTEKEYVQAIQDYCPELILSDYDLPAYNGALALAEARKRCPDTPFILVTGAVTEDRAIDILTQGAKDYVLKTRIEQRLVPAVKRALAEAEEHQARRQAEAELREAHKTLEERVKIRTAELQEQIETRKRTEEALRDSEERQRLVLRSSSIGTFEVDLLTGEGRWNETEFELLGLRPGDVKASPDAFFRFVHPDDVERLRNEWEEAMRYGKFDSEFRIVRADGQECWLAGKGSFIGDGHPDGDGTGTGGKPRRFMGVNFDITGRRKAEEAVAAAHRQVQSIIDNTTAIIYAFDLEGRFVMANAAIAELLNSTPEQMIGKRRHEFMPKDDADWHEGNDRQTIEAGRALEFEEYSQLRDRSITWFTTKFPLRDAQGRIYGVAGISADVSERKQAQEMLRESEERYRGVVENTTAIILRLDPRGVINFANSRALGFFGYTADELIGRHAVGSIVPARESTGRDLAAMVDQIAAYPDRFHSNANENICKDGRRVWLEWTNSGIYWADGRLKELLCVGIDATVRKQAEEALKQQSDRLEAANKELESFSYSVSHDLRAPLRAIDGYSRMILKKQGEQLDEETRQRLQMIKDNAKNMGRLIDDLLALSRFGSQAVTKKNLNMEELVSEVWSELLAMHPDRKMTLKNGPMPVTWGDRSLIWQVYSNLLGNAAKFTHGRECALIETGGFVRNGEMIYYVRDNGVGFEMKFCDKLFGAFQRLHSEEEYKGTGIGLALVRRIIQRHDGRVWAEGEVDKGATFYFTLPTQPE